MVHILGMSHAISVVRALDSSFAHSHQNWNEVQANADWSDLNVGHGVLPDGTAKAFLISPAMGWQAQLQKNQDGEQLSASPGYWQLLNSIQSSRGSNVLFSFLGGNDHSVLSLIEHPVPYDFYLPGDGRYPMLMGRQPVPLLTIQTLIGNMIKGTVAMLTAIRYTLPNWRVVHAMPPPPIASEEQIHRVTEEYFRTALAQYGVTPISIRMKVYVVYCQLMQEALSKLDIQTLYPPIDAQDAGGALIENYALGCTHGNDAYGALVACQINQYLRGDHASL
jgi:hypothetical protein